MIRALLVAAVTAVLLSACTQTGNPDYGRGSNFNHGGGPGGPSFSTRIVG
jgi:hypothetical protein